MSRSEEAVAAVASGTLDFLVENGLASPADAVTSTPLIGGVSSELWRITAGSRTIVIKAALAKLKVASEWHAPLDRNKVEWDWLVYTHSVAPRSVPTPLAHHPERGFFAMEYLPPDDYPVWKHQLMDRSSPPHGAAAVGDLLGSLHATSAGNEHLARRFRTDLNFHALRIEPYLLTTAQRHPSLTVVLKEIAETTASTHLSLVHGDVSPKNILMGPGGPVLIDGECAWFGDPAFDVGSVLTHLALKTVLRQDDCEAMLTSALDLVNSYQCHVNWEKAGGLLSRASRLLPALMLARIDGKAPVEYLDSTQQELVRGVARTLLLDGPQKLRVTLERVFNHLSYSKA